MPPFEAFDDAAARLLWPEKRLRVTKDDLSDYHALHQHLWPKAGGKSEAKKYSQLTDDEKADGGDDKHQRKAILLEARRDHDKWRSVEQYFILERPGRRAARAARSLRRGQP